MPYAILSVEKIDDDDDDDDDEHALTCLKSGKVSLSYGTKMD